MNRRRIAMTRLHLSTCAILFLAVGDACAQSDAIKPDKPIALFNGRDLSGLTTWLKDSRREDPKRVFSVKEAMLHVSGEGNGYIATDKAYADYHLTVEYRWGKRTDGGKFVRNSGILLHATGADGGAGGTWMTSIECHLARGCVRDLIVIRASEA